MKTINARIVWSRILVGVGVIGMLVGAVDPMEGSLVILPGSGLVTLGTFLGNNERRLRVYWLCIFSLIVLGVAALFALSSVGGIGGPKGHSMWWGLFLLPYPIGWILGIANLISRLIGSVRHRHVASLA